jgi:hypothetical protein
MNLANRLGIVVGLLAAAVWTAYAAPCDSFFTGCTDTPCPGGCGVATGSPAIIKTCAEPVGGTCCRCIKYVYSCTVCGSTADATATVVSPGDCVSNGRICEEL